MKQEPAPIVGHAWDKTPLLVGDQVMVDGEPRTVVAGGNGRVEVTDPAGERTTHDEQEVEFVAGVHLTVAIPAGVVEVVDEWLGDSEYDEEGGTSALEIAMANGRTEDGTLVIEATRKAARVLLVIVEEFGEQLLSGDDAEAKSRHPHVRSLNEQVARVLAQLA